ncbi:MAG: hypothetical protein KBG19_00510 [Bacteroidales bacterium]|nr:hypothetical protein [Bacteroidales bacterium]
MKLVTKNGAIALPENFTFSVEQNSAFFSRDGAYTIPANIPAAPASLEALGHPERIAKAGFYSNRFPASLLSGNFFKTGQLILDSAQKKQTIVASLAIEDSDFYSQQSSRSLRDIFSQMVRTDFSTVEDWYEYLFSVYTGEETDDFVLFPVAVDKNDSGYFVNNMPTDGEGIRPLDWRSKIIAQGRDQVSYPDGYGISVFLKFHRFINLLFFLTGYTMIDDPFTRTPLNKIVLINNTSDLICNAQINYADLVPDITVSEFLEFMQNKFHAQFRVFPDNKTVRVVLFEDILSGPVDLDISKKLEDDWQVIYNNQSRIVISSDTSLEGAEPASDTLASLYEKYKYIYEFMESEWNTTHKDSLVLRLSTGCYYEFRRTVAEAGFGTERVLIGTNYFPYDRKNTDKLEDFKCIDLLPPMVFVGGVLMPYIGKRINRNILSDFESAKEKQSVILCNYGGLSSTESYCFGTTQAVNDAGIELSDTIRLTPEGLYAFFWKQYNELLLNCLVEVRGIVHYTVQDINQMNIYALKLYDGQKLLPKQINYEIGKHLYPGTSDYLVIKKHPGSIVDPIPGNLIDASLRWKINKSEYNAILANIVNNYPGAEILAEQYIDGMDESIFLGIPTIVGQVSFVYLRTIQIKYRYPIYGGSVTATENFQFYIWYDAVQD